MHIVFPAKKATEWRVTNHNEKTVNHGMGGEREMDDATDLSNS